LLEIEGFPVDFRFDPERRPQRPVLAAVDPDGPQLLLEAHDPLESGVRGGQASDRAVPLHSVSLPALGNLALFNSALASPPCLLACAMLAAQG